MLKNIYTDIRNVEDYVNNLIKPRSVSLEIQKTNFCDDKYNSKDMFYIARTPIFTENAEQELLNEQKKLNQASLTKNSSQKELVQTVKQAQGIPFTPSNTATRPPSSAGTAP